MVARDPESLRRIRQRRLLPGGGAALVLAAVGDVVLDSPVVFGVGLVAVAVLAVLMGAVTWLEWRADGPEFSEISVFRWQEDAP